MTDYPDALEQVHRIQARDAADPRINPRCGPQLLTHDRQTERAIVFLHGITSSPPQFQALGQLFHRQGYNVLIPRMPYHGYHDRLTRDPARLTAARYLQFVSEAVDAARGLGKRLTVVGLSVSGVLVGWVAQHRTDVERAVLIAPAFAPMIAPMRLTPAISRVLLSAPNLFVWWDPRRREKLGPDCVYPRFSTHAIAESFRLASVVFEQSRWRKPSAQTILCITNAQDPAVSNAATATVLRRWQTHSPHPDQVQSHELRGVLPALHDFISPYQHGARTDVVYPMLFDLIDDDSAAARQR